MAILATRRFSLTLILAVVVPVLTSAAAIADPSDPQYAITALGQLDPDQGAQPTAINAAGQVVGVSPVQTGSSVHAQAFLYTPGTPMQSLVPSRLRSWAYGINSLGDVVGSRTPESISSPVTAFLYTSSDGKVNDLPGLTDNSTALGINDLGQIVGFIGASPFNANRAFLLSGGVLVDIHAALPAGIVGSSANGINAAGVVVGSYYFPDGGSQAFVKNANGAPTDLPAPAGGWTEARAVSDSGYIAGAATGVPGFGWAAVFWLDGQIHPIGALGGPMSAEALGVNSRGDVVGTSTTDETVCPSPCTYVQHAFLYRGGQLLDLNDLIPPDSGYELESASAINASGQIVAIGRTDDGGSHALLLTPAAPTPGQRITALMDTVRGFGLADGIENSFLTKLVHALASLEAGDLGTACQELQDFIDHARAQSGKKLTIPQANEIIEEASAIREALGCA